MAETKQKNSEQTRPQKTNRIAFIVLVSLALVVIAAIVITSIRSKQEGGTGDGPDGWYADIEIRDYGTITVYLDRTSAPITVDNFVSLAQSGFYDGLTFHRIMNGFMMRGGDPMGNGSGNSGTKIKGEFPANGWTKNQILHERGVISMARATSFDSASCQFFIMQAAAPRLDGQYAAFGWVTSGIEIVDRVCSDAKPVDKNGTIPSNEQPVITKITVRRAEGEPAPAER